MSDFSSSKSNSKSSDSNCESKNSSITSSNSSDSDQLEDFYDFKGKIVDDYNIIKLLGRGSFSGVWLCYSISESKFYAMKIQNPGDYKDGVEEIKILKQLPKNRYILDMKRYFVLKQNKNSFLCSVYDLHFSNIDQILRKGNYKEGFPLECVKKIFYQIVYAISILHDKCKFTHCDLKTDNILVKGINEIDKKIIDLYISENFSKKYLDKKKEHWCVDLGKNESKIKNMKSEVKLKIRKSVHKEIINNIESILNENLESTKKDEMYKYGDDLKKLDITLADFGATCTNDEFYEDQFGTRYYMSPEVLLMGKITNKIDIWSLGCILYELINGSVLFDPEKDKNHSRDYYHLLEISKVSGRFDKRFLKTTKFYKNYFDKNCYIKNTEFREYYDLNELFDKIDNKLEKDLVLDLIKKTLKIDPKERISAREILNHKWFSEYNYNSYI